jgi:hypothetical protein
MKYINFFKKYWRILLLNFLKLLPLIFFAGLLIAQLSSLFAFVSGIISHATYIDMYIVKLTAKLTPIPALFSTLQQAVYLWQVDQKNKSIDAN